MSLQPRVVQVHRRSEYDELLAPTRHPPTGRVLPRQHVAHTIDELAERHHRVQHARALVAAAIPHDWRRTEIERSDLHHFRFAPEDIVVVVGQDGLVANIAKYLDGQPVIGVDPEPNRNPGVLVPHCAEAVPGLLAAVSAERAHLQRRTMVSATTDDGQELRAVNEIYIGHRSHQSARYRLETAEGDVEHHSSSGVLAGTGTGATGWLRSVWQERHSPLVLPEPESPDLCWFVREAWPSAATGADVTEGRIGPGGAVTIVAESDELVCFGDGIERDALRIGWGQKLTIAAARQTLDLVVDG